MIKRYAVLLFAVTSVLFAAPIFATTTCQAQNGPGPMYTTTYECIQSGPSSSWNFTYYAPSQDMMCYLYPSGGLYKSLGAYGSGNGDWSFIPPNAPNYYFSVKIILDLNNTQYHSGNRFAVLVYDDDNYTVETLGEINGAGGDICSGTYTFNVYRPGWASADDLHPRHLRLRLSALFQDYDANSKLGYVSFAVSDQQTW